MDVGYFYSKHNGRVRWILVPDHPSELDRPSRDASEAMVRVPHEEYLRAARDGHVGHQAVVTVATSIAPTDDPHVAAPRGETRPPE